jgi:hypothetical protein
MGSLMALTAKGRQPRLNASSGNALFLVFYMLVRRFAGTRSRRPG